MPLNEVESKAILAACGIPLPKEIAVKTSQEAVDAADSIGYPVVLKAISRDALHKSDAGLVILSLVNGDAVRLAADSLSKRCRNAGFHCDGLLVAQQMSGGIETVLGIHRDPEMGPVVMFGMGGVWLELFKDVSFAPPDLTRSRALDMISRTRVSRLLEGYRGSKPSDTNALADALVALGNLASSFADCIESIDINPFLVREAGAGAFALDGLVILRPPTIDQS
jgi:acetate---CoA ligase (ADP-forming)